MKRKTTRTKKTVRYVVEWTGLFSPTSQMCPSLSYAEKMLATLRHDGVSDARIVKVVTVETRTEVVK